VARVRGKGCRDTRRVPNHNTIDAVGVGCAATGVELRPVRHVVFAVFGVDGGAPDGLAWVRGWGTGSGRCPVKGITCGNGPRRPGSLPSGVPYGRPMMTLAEGPHPGQKVSPISRAFP
jgi:hypothetical protein